MKRTERSELAHIKRVLREWDPIGVQPGESDDSAPPDEYDSYAPGILSRLRGGASPESILELLTEIRVKSLELTACPEKDRLISDQLVAWWKSGGAGGTVIAPPVESSEIEHLAAILKIVRHIKPAGLSLFYHEYYPQVFGSFTLIAGKPSKLIRFVWDGKESELAVSDGKTSREGGADAWKPATVIKLSGLGQVYLHILEDLSGRFFAGSD